MLLVFFGPNNNFFIVEVRIKCLNHSRTGNCKFYECFHQRFPCDKSHVIDYEIVACQKFENAAQLSNDTVGS